MLQDMPVYDNSVIDFKLFAYLFLSSLIVIGIVGRC